MASLNKVILCGNMTAEAEIKQTTSGTPVCKFTLAVNRKFAKEGQQTTDFFSVIGWKQIAEYIGRYGAKGRNVLLCGHIQQRQWTDNDGNNRYAFEVVADEVSFTDRQPNLTQTTEAPVVPISSPAPYTSEVSYEDMSGDDDLPF